MLFLSLLTMVAPFRFFCLISYLKKYLDYFNKFASTIYRVIYSALIYYSLLVILIVFWGLAYFIAFKGYNENFDTWFKSIVSFLLLNSAAMKNKQ